MEEALVVVDMLNDFIHQEGSLYVGDAGENIVPFIEDEIAKKRENNEAVIYLCDSHKQDDLEFNLFPPHCVKNSWGANIITELEPQKNDIVIPKRRYSGFFGTELDLNLKENGVQSIKLVGVCTNICILYTAADAVMLQYNVKVPEDGVASFDNEAHNFAVKQMNDILGVEII